MTRAPALAAAAATVAAAVAAAALAAPAPAPAAPASAVPAPSAAPAPDALRALAAGPAASTAARRCVKPSQVRFSRKVGSTVGVLRWRARGPVRVTRNGRVVGQTRKRALRVPVKLGRSYRFAVAPLSAAGRPQRCAARKRLKVRYRLPGAPRQLSVGGDEAGITLTWRRGARGDGRLAGYRLLRDDAVVGQTRDTSWRLAVTARRRHRFRVVAVDTRGRVSRPSNAVDAETALHPPRAPQGVQALAVSESEVGVSWQPSRFAAAYRVLRDGVVVRQVEGTSHVIGNLAPSTLYRLQVVAVDALGRASEPSAAVAARTQDPVPTSGHAHAYLLASTDHSFADFRAHYRQIAVVHPTYFDCTSRLDLVGRDDPLVTRWASARKVVVLPRVNCQGTTKVHRLLTEPDLRRRWLDDLVALAAQHDYDGISIDFEAGPASDREALSTFVEELAARLHADGRRLAIAASAKVRETFTHPRSGIFDYDRLSRAVDWVFVMAWGLHWATSVPGPQDDVRWVTGVADYVATMPLKHKFVYGTNLYAMDWPNGGGAANPGTAYQHGDIVPRLPQLGAAVALDPAADNWHAVYTDAAGARHDVWYPDAETTARRMRLARERGIGGIGFWRLGLEDQRLWSDPLLAPGSSW